MANSDVGASQKTFEVSSLSAVSIKLPAFWSAQPKIWFAQAESQFVLQGISSEDTRYHHVLSALDQDTAKRVIDVIEKPSDNKYQVLKERLLTTFTMSPYRMAQKLLNMAPLGDRNPSELMDDMLALINPSHGPCTIFMTIFVDLMPPDVRSHLLPIVETSSPRELAILADKLISTNPLSIAAIGKKIVGSNADGGSTSKGWCRLHQKWGNKAYRCEHPCSFISSHSARISKRQGNFEDGHQ